VERCYVERPLYDKFVAAVVARTKQLRQGDGLQTDVEMGPMTRRPERERVHNQVQQALSMGAEALTGGKMPDGKGWFYPPTVLVKVDHRMDCVARETFGPLLPIMAFDREDEAVRMANDSTLGLTGSVWSTDFEKANRIARQIDTGTVMINETTYTFGLVETPWGGRKDSGLGWTHGMLGLHEFVRPHHIHTNKRPGFRDLWWFPYTAKARKTFETMIRWSARL
jgi:succinate-semialdehyde dehydrogenase/glutarate-semialdehyde dehydrogenase